VEVGRFELDKPWGVGLHVSPAAVVHPATPHSFFFFFKSEL